MTPLFLASAVSDSLPASVHGVLPAGILTLADAAARALLVACIVGASLYLLARRHVPAQKMAWGLVLAPCAVGRDGDLAATRSHMGSAGALLVTAHRVARRGDNAGQGPDCCSGGSRIEHHSRNR